MQESLIKVATAKLAKEKGFNLETLFYCTSFGNGYIEKSDHSGYPIYTIRGRLESFNTKYPISKLYDAPTQSELQTWLRTKNIIVFITPIEVSTGDSQGVRFAWDISDFKGEMLGGDDSPLGFLTYEEALEKGLEEGLKLLPNKE